MRINPEKIGILVPEGRHIRPAIGSLLDSRGIKTELWSNGRLHADVENAPVTLTFQNHADVIGEVEDGISQAGFVGSDRYAEYLASLAPGVTPRVGQLARFELFNSHVRLSLLVRDNPLDNGRFQNLGDLRNRRVLTTYPGLVSQSLMRVFPGESLPVHIYSRVTGKEEGHVDARRFDAAGVIVDTGKAMRTNNLRELATIMEDIQPVLVYNVEYFKDKGRKRLLNRFKDMLQADNRSGSSVPDLSTLSPMIAVA